MFVLLMLSSLVILLLANALFVLSDERFLDRLPWPEKRYGDNETAGATSIHRGLSWYKRIKNPARGMCQSSGIRLNCARSLPPQSPLTLSLAVILIPLNALVIIRHLIF